MKNKSLYDRIFSNPAYPYKIRAFRRSVPTVGNTDTEIIAFYIDSADLENGITVTVACRGRIQEEPVSEECKLQLWNLYKGGDELKERALTQFLYDYHLRVKRFTFREFIGDENANLFGDSPWVFQGNAASHIETLTQLMIKSTLWDSA
jgi:hypothetical protein